VYYGYTSCHNKESTVKSVILSDNTRNSLLSVTLRDLFDFILLSDGVAVGRFLPFKNFQEKYTFEALMISSAKHSAMVFMVLKEASLAPMLMK
jgi:hypothetical protein